MSQNDPLARAMRYAERLSGFLSSVDSLPLSSFCVAIKWGEAVLCFMIILYNTFSPTCVCKNTQQDDVVLTLQKLEKLDVSLHILTKTGIGKKVNELRKKPIDENAQKLCKNLVKKWKTLLEGGGGTSSPSDGALKRKLAPDDGSSSSPLTLIKSSSNQSDSQHSVSSPGNSNAAAADSEENSNDSASKKSKIPTFGENGNLIASRDQKTMAGGGSATSQEAASGRSSFASSFSGDPQRQGFREMLISSLRNHEPWPEGALDPVEIGNDVEEVIFVNFRARSADDSKYKNKVRAKVKALRDPKNPALREMVLTGAINAERFVNMTAEEMASDEVKALRKKLTQEGINDHLLSVQQGTNTDMFKCSKCKDTKCTYTQLQTRSSDEPMTTFVCCLSCGNRWKKKITRFLNHFCTCSSIYKQFC